MEHNENDSVKLLRECDAGVQMGVDSITDVLDDVRSDELREFLNACKAEHEGLRDEIQRELASRGVDGKAPNPIAKGMSKMKTGLNMAAMKSDATIAKLMTEGCNMGIESLSKYLNQYAAADERAQKLAKTLIAAEERLCVKMRAYL
ncbi:MAG: hypothetical protein IJK23_13885 [Clostridia bacterium]|nr:hypothetical protein [Clostridia bacterium]